MGLQFRTITPGLKDIDLTPRFRADNKLRPELIDIDGLKKNHHHLVQKDKHGEYTFTLESLQLTGEPHQEFYDGQVKVLESWYDEQTQSVVIHVLSKTQTNLFVDINANECMIKAEGSLCIDGQFNVKSALGIAAENLCLLDAVECSGQVALKAEKGLYLSSRLNAKNLNVDAVWLQQSATIQVEGQYDLSAQMVQQSAGSKTRTGALRLVSQQCEIAGELDVDRHCFLVANDLVFGDSENTSTNIQLRGEHHVHAISGLVQGDTHVLMSDIQKPLSQNSLCIFDEYLCIDPSSTIKIKNSIIDLNTIENEGGFYIDHCDVSIKNIDQHGYLETDGSAVFVSGQFDHATSDMSVFNQSTFHGQSTIINGGSVEFNDSEWTGERANVISGLLRVENNSDIYLKNSIITDKDAHFEMVDSQLDTNGSALFYGSVTLDDDASIKCDVMRIHNNKLNLNQATISVDTNITLDGDLDIKNSTIRAENILLSGVLNIDESMLYADRLNYKSQKANINETIAIANIISIDGSDTKGAVTITGGRHNAKTFRVLNKVLVRNSTLVGIDDANMRHDIRGVLSLDNSCINTKSQLHHLKGSHLELCSLSSIRAGDIHSKGSISAQTSEMHCDALVQDGAALDIKSSTISVKNRFRTNNAKVNLDEGSSLPASDVLLGNDTGLRLGGKSTLFATQRIISDSSSSIESEQSIIAAQKFVLLGRTELQKSLLSSKELLIFNQFDVKDKTVINIEERISLAKTAKAQLESSAMFARDIDSFGHLAIADSQVNVKDTISLWTNSDTKMKGTASIIANDAVLRGSINTEKNMIEDENQLPTPESKSILKIKNELHVSPDATVTGNEDLDIDSDVITWLGTADLDAKLCAKGRKLTNVGSIAAKSIFLGFDDAVVNHGSLSAKSMTIHSNFFNILGGAYVQESFSCSGFMSVNLGVIAANNYSNDSFLSLQSGLVLPNFSANLEYIFSSGNKISMAKTAAMMVMPSYTNSIQLLGMIPGAINTAKSAYDLADKLDLETLSNMRRHELMPWLCKIKNAGMFVQGAVNTGIGAVQNEIKIWDAGLHALVNDPKTWGTDAWLAVQSADYEKIGMRTAGLFAGSYTDNSLFNANTGASFAGNTSINSYGHWNMGIERSAFSHNINTSVLYNSGTSTGREASFSATSIKNNGTLAGTNHFTVSAGKVENSKTGTLQGSGANVEIKELHQNGNLNIEKGRLEVDAFTDDVDSNTKLTDVMLTGATFDQSGNTDFNNVFIDETDHYITHAGSEEKNNNVAIKTKDFEHHGTMSYENRMSITAENGLFAKGSVVNGKNTDDEKLFVPKEVDPNAETKADDAKPSEETTQTSSEKAEDIPKESEKDFKPQNIVLLDIDHLKLGGKLSGGDYTQIKGENEDIVKEDGTKETALCEDLTIDESAEIDLKYGSISAKKGNVSSSKVVLDSFNITIKEGSFNHNSAVTLNNSSYTGDVLDEHGSLILDHSHVKVTNVHLGQDAHETLIDSIITSSVMKDESQMSYQGQAAIITDTYEHTGHVSKIAQPADSKDKNLFYVKAKTAKLDGSTDLDNGFYDIEHLSDGTQFAAGTGKYTFYLASDSMAFKTDDSFRLYESIQRNCDVSVQAADIYYGGNHNKQHDLTFVSTVGDVTLTNNIQARNLFVKSAKNIYTNSSINTESILSLEAEGGYYNYGGTLNGNDVAVKASEIKNYTNGSSAVAGGTLLPMGNAGVINARSKLFFEATQGNIENHGGILRAGDYAQLLAKGNVLNLCNVKTSQGRYDTLQQFDGGLISGGSGKDTDGVGLYIKAEGQVISDASDFVSNGSNYIEGVHGVQFTARSHTAITKNETTKTWYGKKKTVVETSTVVKGCNIQSANGRNIIQSGEGSVTSVASKFISPGGTDITAKGDVKLFSLKTKDQRIESTSYLWGLSKKDIDSIHQNATPTLFYDNGATRITSAEGNVDARGAYFVGAGDLSIKAKKHILFGVDILDHEINEKSNSFSFSGTGLGAWDACKNGGNAWDAVTAEDATLAKMNSLYGSNNAAETLANSSNLGIDLCNTSNRFMRGLSQGGLTHEAMARYGMGGAAGFAPSLTLSMTQSKTNTTYQTQSQGGVDCGGNVKLEAGEGVVLENGVRVHAGGNLEVDAPVLVARSAALETKVKQTTVTESLGVTPLSGQVQSADISYSSTRTQSTTHQNAELSAGGNMYLHNQDKAMDLVELDGANISAKTVDMNTNKLVIRDKQDTSQTKTESFSVNSSGQFSVYEGKGHEKIINQSSGIYVADGINTDGHKVHAGETYMEGGKILTDGVNRFETDKLESHALEDEKEFRGVGISGNVNDLKRFTDQKPENIAGEQTIATATFTYDNVDYKATQQSVIYGAKGTELDIKESVSDAIHTTSADGKVIQKDESMHLQVDIPITNEEYLKTRSENIKEGKEKLAEMFGLNQGDKDPVAFGRAEPIKPVEEEEEEEEEENELEDDSSKKDTGDKEIDLSSAEAREIVGGAMDNLKFDSPEKEKEFQNTAEKAKQEIENNGKMSPKTENKLKSQVTEALLKTLKAGSEDKWGKLIDKMGPEYKKSLIKLLSNPETSVHASIKSYMSAKGVAISFVYNLVLASVDSKVHKGDEIKHAAAGTSADITFGFVLKLGLRTASGSVSAGLFVFSIADCFYSEKRVADLNKSGVSHVYDSQKLSQQEHPLDAWAMRQVAGDELRTAAGAQAGHFLANITQPISDLFENKWNEYKNKHQENKKSPPAANTKPSTQGMFKFSPASDTDEYKFQQLDIR